MVSHWKMTGFRSFCSQYYASYPPRQLLYIYFKNMTKRVWGRLFSWGGRAVLRQWRACREAFGQRLELAEGTLPRGKKPPCCTFAELFFSCCVSVAALPAIANFIE
jgi:hypothetical protein